MKHASHHRALVLTIALLVFFAVACGGSTGDDAANLASTAAALQSTQDALAAVAQPIPTQSALSAASTQAAQPTEEAPTDEAPQEPVSEDEPFYVEEFDVIPENWFYLLLNGTESDFDLYADNGRLIFDIQGESTWPYYFYNSYIYTDVRLDITAENLGNNNNNVSLICRGNERGWYEFNVANNGLYSIFRYESDTNNFHELYTGGVQNMKTGKATNDYTVICEGDRLTLGVNGVEVRTVTDSLYDEGQVGVGVSSFTGTPVLVEVEYVAITLP